MGSSVCQNGVGSIVWVRRRNGSWWPGKILGPDELSASHLMSPRSGTPVKLLGREDASVDWYNLEKSKRVKAFRCGEFDDCIEKAEASLGLPVKKREKYARREDAILHALELEKQYLVKNGKVGSNNSVRETSSDSERKNLATTLLPLENGYGKSGCHQLYQLVKKVDSSKMLVRNVSILEQKPRDTHPRLQEHDMEGSHHMRGLQEFGLSTVPVNGMVCSAASDDSKRMTVDDHAYAALNNNLFLRNSSDSDSRNSIGKGKRLLEGFIGESPSKQRRHDTHHVELPDHAMQPGGDFISIYEKEQTADSAHRSLYFRSGSPDIFDINHSLLGQMKTSVSRSPVGNSHLQHGTLAEESTSISSEETESDSSETHSLEQFDAGMMHSDAETGIRMQPSTFDRLEMGGGHESTSSEECEELSLDKSQFYSEGLIPSVFGVSKWQLKGKRNNRNSSRRPMDSSIHTSYERRVKSLIRRTPNHSLGYYHENDDNDINIMGDDINPHAQRFGSRGYLPSRTAAERQNFFGQTMIDWKELAWGGPFRGYWEGRGQNGHNILLDVDLKVQANRQGEHVPWVSLMSRLNGKAIIGHPIQIEALEDGSTDILVSTTDTCRVPPVWKTARRTAKFRVPFSHLSSELDDDEGAEDQCISQSGKVESKKSRPSVKNNSIVSRSKLQGNKKKKKKKPRNGNLCLNQKTKPLSSFGYDQKVSNKRQDSDTSSYLGGVMKPLDGGPPAVACIPVKLVFSRLLEAIGRPPGSISVKHKDRNPP